MVEPLGAGVLGLLDLAEDEAGRPRRAVGSAALETRPADPPVAVLGQQGQSDRNVRPWPDRRWAGCVEDRQQAVLVEVAEIGAPVGNAGQAGARDVDDDADPSVAQVGSACHGQSDPSAGCVRVRAVRGGSALGGADGEAADELALQGEVDDQGGDGGQQGAGGDQVVVGEVLALEAS